MRGLEPLLSRLKKNIEKYKKVEEANNITEDNDEVLRDRG